ncbi:uroporphyrin-III C-methyltransferase [Lactarius quietus]|nr:uroporphyrin-III C-methyltransferase [Lactarius quietus]
MDHVNPHATFSEAQRGASLLLAFRAQPGRGVLIIGSDQLAASRAFSALEAEFNVIIMTPGGRTSICEELAWRADHSEVTIIDSNSPPASGSHDANALAACLDEHLSISLVFITDTVLSGSSAAPRRSRASAELLYGVCRTHRVPANITDMPDLCDFTLPSAHRVPGTPLQLAITTNGQGCRLGSRIRRELVARLPRDAGAAVARMGELRRLARADGEVEADADDEHHASTPNRPVPQRRMTVEETDTERSVRRMRWVSQISEYWSYSHIAGLTQEGMENVLSGNGPGVSSDPPIGTDPGADSRHGLAIAPPSIRGRIFLVGSGPGHPGLLTVATRDILTTQADLVLSDKLVPEAVLAVIPKQIEVQIARKFPGNAEGAQQEIMETAVDAARRGLTVVRLKQGDPTVYGRVGEEILYFRQRGLEAVVVPGVSSALAGPLCAGIPVTQRGVAESFIVCTGVGRQGQDVVLPGYERARTLVILMGVARITQLLETLQTLDAAGRRNGPPYPAHTPIAIIEPTITSTLAHVVSALESNGAQRPPGMIVVGWSILSLWGDGDMTGQSRVVRWMNGKSWRVVEGFNGDWDIP